MHAAFFREFDGIADEIGQHLAQPDAVDADSLGHIGPGNGDELDVFGMRARTEKLDHAFDQDAEFGFFVFQRQRAGFDLGEIQNVADQSQQRFARLR